MDEKMKHRARPESEERLDSSSRASADAKPAGGSAARSLAAPERKGIGGAQAGTGSVASTEGDVTGSAVDTPATRKIAADTEAPPRDTKASVVFRQVTVGKQSPPAASEQDSGLTALSTGQGGKKPAEEGADSLNATRLLTVAQLASAFSKRGKDRTDTDAASPAVQPRHNPASSREKDQQQIGGTLPRVAGNDESTQYFRLYIPESGPIRGEPAPADDAGQTQESPGPAEPRAISRNLDGLQAPQIPSDAAKMGAHTDTGKLNTTRESRPAPRTSPPATEGKLHALLPAVVILNLGLTLLTLAANVYLVFHILAAGR